MIVGKPKSIEDIIEMTRPYRRILIVGCGSCLTVCRTGGGREISIAARAISLARLNMPGAFETHEIIVQRQCEPELCEDIPAMAREFDAILSFGCAAGMQTIADLIRTIPILPGIDTQFMGRIVDHRRYIEQCIGCGDCTIDQSEGICLISRCPKAQQNEPCGGSDPADHCEVNPDLECVWVTFARRLGERPGSVSISKIIEPKDWSRSHAGGVRSTPAEPEP